MFEFRRPVMPVKVAMQQAIAKHQNGYLQEAQQLYLNIVKNHPTCSDAYRNLLTILYTSGQIVEMETHARFMIEHLPKSGIAWKGLGLALHLQGKDALQAFQMTTRYLPDDAEGHDNLGVALKKLGRFDDAVLSFRRAIKFDQKAAGAYVNLANTQKELGEFDAALLNYRTAIKIQPELAVAHNNLGNLLRDLGQIDAAIDSYRRALRIKPGFAEAHNNLSIVLKEKQCYAEAESCCRAALQLKSDFAEAYFNLGVILGDQGRLAEAQESYDQALALAPNNLMFRMARLMTILPIVPQNVSVTAKAVEAFDLALRDLSASMTSSDTLTQQLLDPTVLQLPFYLAYRPGNHVELLSRFADLLKINDNPVSLALPPSRAKPRLVIVSHHFCRHSVWDIVTRGLLANLDRSRFEVVLYHLGRVDDEETALAKSLADVWRDSHGVIGFGEWVRALQADQPDIIFYPEVGMDPMAFMLASCRFAPLQVAGWGHPVTSGLSTIDLYFSAELFESSQADTHYREQLVRLPGTGCCTTVIEHLPGQIPELARQLAARAGPKFIIAQMPFKLDPSDDDLFAQIAATAGKSTFILVAHPQFHWATQHLEQRLGQAFLQHGLNPEEHIIVMPWQTQDKFYALLDLVDVFLDCPSFSGYTTAWMAAHRGVPIVTLEGELLRERLASGLLRRIGLDDLVATTREQYIAIAVRLARSANEPEQRETRRRNIKAAAARADNDIRVVRAFETSLLDALEEKGTIVY